MTASASKLLGRLREAGTGADDGHPLDAQVALAGVVVEEAQDDVSFGPEELQHLAPGVARSVDEDAATISGTPSVDRSRSAR